jgi:hypothetical protein
MSRGPLYELSKRAASRGIAGCLFLTAICAGVLALNRTFFYNWWTGPVAFTSALSERPGLQRWVRADGPMIPTGLQNVTKVRLLKGLVETEHVSARYSAMLVDGRMLVVLSDAELAAVRTAKGALQPLPDDVKTRLGVDDSGRSFHPWLLDTRRGFGFADANLFVWIFTPAFGLCLLLTIFAGSERLRPHSSIVFSGLKRYGDPDTLAGQIDDELRAVNADMRNGAIWLTRSWIVGLTRPAVFRLADLVGVGVSPGTAGDWRIVCWERGQNDSHTFDVSPAEGERIRDRLRQASPGLLVADVASFEARWKADRLVCEAAALARGTTAHPPAA